jgi:hypothetical protein
MADSTELAGRLRTPRSAAVAGIVFAVILTGMIAAIRTSIAGLGGDPSDWVNSPSGRGSVTLAVNLIPFAGIAFLWFIGVIRTRLGDLEDRLFATVFLGSGLLFVAMLFTAAAAAGSLIAVTSDGQAADESTQRFMGLLTSGLLGAFGARMAAVFTLSVTTLGLRTGLIPRWLGAVGYLVPIALFLTPPLTDWVQLLFPLWVLLLSGHILYVSFREPVAGSGALR